MSNKNPSVMVLEPNRLQRDLISMALRRNHFESIVCNSPLELRQNLSTCQPEAILLDLVLPGQNGLELIRELQSESALKNTKFFIISSIAFPEVVQKAVYLGAVDFLVKPLNIDLLINRVKRVIGIEGMAVLN